MLIQNAHNQQAFRIELGVGKMDYYDLRTKSLNLGWLVAGTNANQIRQLN